MARLLYTIVLWLALPLVLVRLLWRARLQPEYRANWRERFGRYPAAAPDMAGPTIWLHAVSVGEAHAARPLVAALRARHPDNRLLLTCMTPTGRAAALALFAGDRNVVVTYLPYDYPFALRRFLRRFRPRTGILLETELWPNLMAECAAQGVPVMLANARLSARSASGYRRFDVLARPAFAGLAQVAAQTATDSERLAERGARRITVTGNLKFDVTPDNDASDRGRAWKTALGARRVMLAASTREGEETLLLDALSPLLADGHLLVIVPRHPQRFDAVARLLEARGLRHARRTASAPPPPQMQVWLGDSMGEMPAYYALADCAYVGGSLLPFGGQNMIEAAACGCPVLIGPHTWNFSEAAVAAVACGAALRVADAGALAESAGRLLGDAAERERMSLAAITFARAHRGATERTMALIEPLLRSAEPGLSGSATR